MRIGHWQMQCVPGDFGTNLAKVLEGLERAETERVEIVSFPECFLTGYQDKEEEVRKHAFSVDSPRMREVLDKTECFGATVIVGFNETRGNDLYNTALVAERGQLLGTYSKSCAYMPFHKQGREFPVFERKGVKYGVIICADGGFIEPARILALKGAQIIFAPHYNYIMEDYLISHFMHVRADHTARAVENVVYFVRGNNVVLGRDKGISYDGVGYGDSYIIDPMGEIVVRSRRHEEDFIYTDVDPAKTEDKAWEVGKSLWSLREFSKHLLEAGETQGPKN
ncbi:MAG: carbon-nitrogen hydrolase family protein [Armatimonadetes bacterium]|nr:carbon-nitrogen hydrolase family protein [Armatimonadota bacterium]